MRKYFFIFCIFSNFEIFSQNIENIRLGEINRIDNLSKSIEVLFFNKQLEEALKNKSIEKLLVLDEKNFKLGELEILSYRLNGEKILVQCIAITANMKLFVGQTIGLTRGIRPDALFRDHFAGEAEPEQEILTQGDNGQMVYIPQGPFIFGSDIPGTDHYTSPIEYEYTEIKKEMGKKRIRYLQINAYYIDKYEVTIEQYKKYLRETGSAKPPEWNPDVDSGLPVSNLSYTMADNYCRWAGKRLPTELEWEKAVRGPGISTSYIKDDIEFFKEKLNVYPTGLEFDADVCITRETSNTLANVYKLKDRNQSGLYGTCGNAAEWTSSWFLPYRGNSKKNPDYGRKFKVIRGGAYNLPSRWTKGYERMIGGIPSLQTDFRAGVRCVMDPR